jgi:hypothetical protein
VRAQTRRVLEEDELGLRRGDDSGRGALVHAQEAVGGAGDRRVGLGRLARLAVHPAAAALGIVRRRAHRLPDLGRARRAEEGETVAERRLGVALRGSGELL